MSSIFGGGQKAPVQQVAEAKPTVAHEAVQARADQARTEMRLASGRATTMLTPRKKQQEDVQVGTATLLGS